MEPDTQQYSIDYLNSISTAPPPRTIKPVYLWVLIVGVLVIVAVIVMLILSAGSGNKDNLTSFASSLEQLSAVTTTAQKDIKSSDLRTTNSSLSLVLTNASRDATTFSGKLNKKSDDVKRITAEMMKLTATLEDARLNAVYDRTYAREMNFQLKDLRTQMNALYKRSSSKALSNFLKETDDNIAPLQETFANFNES